MTVTATRRVEVFMSKESGKVSLQIRTSLKKELALVREVVLPVLNVRKDAQG